MIKKPKKAKPISYYRNKCDKLYQEIGRKLYSKCILGCHDYSTLHHFVKKSQSTELRYDLQNGIPICNRHHCSIHQGKDDTVTAKIILIKGKDWFGELMAKKRQGIGKHYGVGYFKQKLEDLKKACE